MSTAPTRRSRSIGLQPDLAWWGLAPLNRRMVLQEIPILVFHRSHLLSSSWPGDGRAVSSRQFAAVSSLRSAAATTGIGLPQVAVPPGVDEANPHGSIPIVSAIRSICSCSAEVPLMTRSAHGAGRRFIVYTQVPSIQIWGMKKAANQIAFYPHVGPHPE